MTLYLKNWYDKLLDELPKTKKLRIISPFVKEQVVKNIQSKFAFTNFELITRFKLEDFAQGGSSLEALQIAFDNGAKIYGIKDLHSKVYIFDDRAAIVTSANLTNGGLVSNHECGIYLTDANTILQLKNYFNELKDAAEVFDKDCYTKWKAELPQMPKSNPGSTTLPDYGGSIGFHFDQTKSYYVKFFGDAHNRVERSFTVKEEVDRALCHYSCGFSPKKKPRQINDNDVIYMARMTRNPHDHAIFGKAEAIKFLDGRDLATEHEKVEREWKRKWSVYLRFKNPTFIDTIMSDCIFLSDLVKALDHESFITTQQQYDRGKRNINPYASLQQQAYVRLSRNAVEWLEPKFQQRLSAYGQVDESFIKSLPKSDIDISSWES